jgi:regulator of RNase E activity RraB
MKSQRFEENKNTMEALINAGSDVNKAHLIEHHLYSYSKEEYEKLIQLGVAGGYELKYEGVVEDKDGDYWQLDLVKSAKPSLDSIELQALEIESYAKQANADYDGWGTEVEV